MFNNFSTVCIVALLFFSIHILAMNDASEHDFTIKNFKTWLAKVDSDSQTTVNKTNRQESIMDEKTTINDLKQIVKKFVDERDWGDKFHDPKNLSMAIAKEAAELMEEFMWCTNEQSPEYLEKRRKEISYELADILGFVLSFAGRFNIDLSKTLQEKMKQNEQKYPVERITGTIENIRQLKEEFKK